MEQFVGMKRIMSTDSQNIFNAISDVINDFGIKWKSVLSMWFDGAATMSGSVNGVQAKFKKENDKAFFVHCYGHCLNLILVDSVRRENRITFDFFW